MITDVEFELIKGVIQLASVAAGVALGFWLNSRFQIRHRLDQTRADWAAAAEHCLGALVTRRYGPQTLRDDPAHPADAADIFASERVVVTTMTQFRAATVRLTLIDHDKTSSAEILAIEAAIVALDRAGESTIRREEPGVRDKIRARVTAWAAAGPLTIFQITHE